MEPLLTLQEAAERLDLSTRTVHRLIRTDDTFPARRIGNRGHWRIDRGELEKWIQEQPTWERLASIKDKRPRMGRPPLSRTSPKTWAR